MKHFTKNSYSSDMRFLTVGFIGVMLMVCGFIGFTLSHLLFEDIYSFSYTLIVAIVFGLGLMIFGLGKFFSGRRRHRTHIQKIIEVDQSSLVMQDEPTAPIDLETALIIPIPHGYNHGMWILVVIEFCLLSILSYFVIAHLDQQDLKQVLETVMLDQSAVSWIVGIIVTLLPIIFIVWLRGKQVQAFSRKTKGRELVLDKNGLHMALCLMPVALQEAMIRDNKPSLFIPWHHIRAWAVQEEGDFSGESGHKFFVAPFPAAHLTTLDQLHLSDIKILRISALYTRHVEKEILEMVEKYGPPVVENITEDV